MTRTIQINTGRLFREKSGQSAVIVALLLSAFIGLAGISVESGHGYLAYRQLVASTNSAVMAGAQTMLNKQNQLDTTTASANVTAYSSVAGNKNTSNLLTNVQVSTTFLCMTTVTNTFKTPCMSSTGSSGGYNGLKVTQTADVPSWFAGLFGIRTFHLSYTATAAMRGGPASNWNIAIILDTTGSMAYSDSGTQCSGTQEYCALLGVQALLSDLYPCGTGQDCTTSTTYVDAVALYVFPPVLSSTASYDYCSGGQYTFRGRTYQNPPTTEYYTVPTLPSTWTYKIIPFDNDYRINDAATTLNTASNIVKATAYTGTSCQGVQPNGSTYYAQVIKQAQADLVTQQNANPDSKNAMIILGDGDITATVTNNVDNYCTAGSYVYSSSTKSGKTTYKYICTTSWLQPSATGALNGIPANNSTSTTYPSALGGCGQAVEAAKAVADAGTSVYTIAYGAYSSTRSGGCASDATYSTSLTTNGGSWAAGGTPCQAMAAMASAQANFYSDDAQGCAATAPSNQAITKLTDIFHYITAGLTAPRLVPNGTT